jgi:hypothetical protein
VKVWWLPFFDETRQQGVERRWLDFRREALFGELQKTLASLGISPDKISQLKLEGAATRRLPREPLHPPQVADLRLLALQIVGRLHDEELRQMRFRLGDVLDALSGK